MPTVRATSVLIKIIEMRQNMVQDDFYGVLQVTEQWHILGRQTTEGLAE